MMGYSYRSLKSIPRRKLGTNAAEIESFISDDDQNYHVQRTRSWKAQFKSAVLWQIIFFIVLLNILANILVMRWRPRTYDIGYETDLKAAYPAVEVHQVRFTSYWGPESNGTTAESQYVGSSSPEIDAAWNVLYKGYWVDLTGDEATSVIGKAKALEDGFYITGLDMFHQLHCVDHLRRTLNEYYDGRESPSTPRVHVDHCIDQLRQNVMCHADMTPRVFVEPDNLLSKTPDDAAIHTCRNWEKLQKWAAERERRGPVATWGDLRSSKSP
jgi:hypothetical protein